jgi:hypothetical protein
MNNLGYFSFFSASANLSNLSYCLFSQEELKFILIKNTNQYVLTEAKPWKGPVLPGTEKALTLIRKQ